MKPKGILFKGEMVRAILEGRKTQTRRLVKPQPDKEHDGEPYWNIGGYRAWWMRKVTDVTRMGSTNRILPKYQVGDVLYVKETFHDPKLRLPKIEYRADWSADDDCNERFFRWTPAIFMPAQHARIWLRVTAVRCERLQDITEADAKAEGCKPELVDPMIESYTDGYQALWTAINGPGSWDLNPWVWVYSFERIEKPGGEQ